MRPDILAKIMDDQNYDQTIISLCWDYLTNRKQRVLHKPSNSISSERIFNVGVPQGTKCGPILWNIFIGSLTSNHNIVKYADNLTIYSTLFKMHATLVERGVKCMGDRSILNEAITSAEWCARHGVTLNASKTKQMVISLKDKIKLNTPV